MHGGSACPILRKEGVGFWFTEDWHIANAGVCMQLASDFCDKKGRQEESHTQCANLLGAVSFEDVELGGEDSVENDEKDTERSLDGTQERSQYFVGHAE